MVEQVDAIVTGWEAARDEARWTPDPEGEEPGEEQP